MWQRQGEAVSWKKAMIEGKRVSALEANGGLRDREGVKYLVRVDKRGGEFERGGERESGGNGGRIRGELEKNSEKMFQVISHTEN